MTASSLSPVGPRAPKDEPLAGWAVLLALLEDWGITLRLTLLIGVPIAAIVVIVALLAIYLGPIGVGTLLTSGAGGGYGLTRFLVHRRHRQSRNKT